MIRRARAEDWEGVGVLWSELDALHATVAPGHFRATARTEKEWLSRLAAPDAGLFVATLDAATVGFAAARLYETPPDPGLVPLRRGHVEMLVVARVHRRRGLGARLMEEVAAWARGAGAAELVLTVWEGNGEAQAFYQRLGYLPLSRALHAKL